MRILHTSDWHVGRTIRGHSRADEHRAVLAELATIADAEDVDVVLVAGDLFDSAAPSAESEQIVYRGLLDLAAAGAQVVLVAGNHDHPRRLEAVAPILAAAGVRTAAAVVSPEDGGVHELRTAAGEVARIVLLPWLSKRAVVRADDLMGGHADEHEGMYATRYRTVVDRLCADLPGDTVNLLLAHVLVAGGGTGGGERGAHTVFEYAVPAAAFPANLHYAALGHLHRTQQIAGRCPLWYSGSPLQMDFGEAGQDKGALLVEAVPGTPASVTPLPLQSGRPLRRVRGTVEQLEAQREDGDGSWLQVVVEGPARAGLADEVREWFPTAVEIRVAAPEQRAADGDAAGIAQRDPSGLFADYLRSAGVEDPRLGALFAELLESASEADGATDPA